MNRTGKQRSAVCPRKGCPHLQPCPTHAGKHNGRSPGRDRTAQARFRQTILERDNYTCRDCGLTDPTGRNLRATHTVPLSQGGTYHPSEGLTRCVACDKRTDPYAR